MLYLNSICCWYQSILHKTATTPSSGVFSSFHCTRVLLYRSTVTSLFVVSLNNSHSLSCSLILEASPPLSTLSYQKRSCYSQYLLYPLTLYGCFLRIYWQTTRLCYLIANIVFSFKSNWPWIQHSSLEAQQQFSPLSSVGHWPSVQCASSLTKMDPTMIFQKTSAACVTWRKNLPVRRSSRKLQSTTGKASTLLKFSRKLGSLASWPVQCQ